VPSGSVISDYTILGPTAIGHPTWAIQDPDVLQKRLLLAVLTVVVALRLQRNRAAVVPRSDLSLYQPEGENQDQPTDEPHLQRTAEESVYHTFVAKRFLIALHPEIYPGCPDVAVQPRNSLTDAKLCHRLAHDRLISLSEKKEIVVENLRIENCVAMMLLRRATNVLLNAQHMLLSALG
jgi:hypothetical protein